MDIVEKNSHRALAYLAALDDKGYRPTAEEVDAYAVAPYPITYPDSYIDAEDWIDDITHNGGHDVEESASGWLTRLLLAVDRDGHLSVTDLGRALLAAADQREQEVAQTATRVIMLKQDDPFAIANVMATIAGVGDAALVDPYMTHDHLMPLLVGANITRILTGPAKSGTRLRQLVAAHTVLDSKAIAVPPIRVLDAFHDRYLIPVNGLVWMLGTSLNGVGKRTSTLIQISDHPAGLAIRTSFEEAWGQGVDLGAWVAADRPRP